MPPSVAGTARSFKSSGSKPSHDRVDHTCSLCGLSGTDPNYFSGVSPYAKFTYVVFSKGTEERPKGNCVACDHTWTIGGWADEFKDEESFKAERDKDPAIQAAFMDTREIYVVGNNTGKRFRARKASSKKGGRNLIEEMSEIRKTRKKIIKRKRERNLKVKLPMKFYTPERYTDLYGKSIEKAGLKPKFYNIHGECEKRKEAQLPHPAAFESRVLARGDGASLCITASTRTEFKTTCT